MADARLRAMAEMARERKEETDTHEMMKAMMFHSRKPECDAHFDKSRPCPADVYGVADSYIELDSLAKSGDGSDFARGKIKFNFAVSGGTRVDAVGTRDEIPTAIEILVEPFTIGLPVDLYDAASTAATAAAAVAAHVSRSVRAGTTAAFASVAYDNGASGVGATLTDSSTYVAVRASTTADLPASTYAAGSSVAVAAATTAALAAATYANGASGVGATLTADANGALPSQDTVALVATDRLLVKDQAAGLQNGVYVVTDAGSAGTPWILTRATDADSSGELTTTVFSPAGGATLSGDNFSVDAGSLTVGTTAITWANHGASIPAGVGATLTADANGALAAQDGVSLAVGDRLVVKDQGTDLENGVYVVTDLGSAGTPWVMARAGDANEPGELNTTLFQASEGDTLAAYRFQVTSTVVTVGTTSVTWEFHVFPEQDGVTLALNDILLVKDQAAALQNGVYYLSSVGGVGSPWVLTRTTDADTGTEITAGYRTVSEGTTLIDDTYYVAIAAITIGTTAIAWVAGLPATPSLGAETDPGGTVLTHGFSQVPFSERVTLQFEEFGRQSRIGRDPHGASARGHHVEFDATFGAKSDRLELTPLSGERGLFIFVEPILDVHTLTAQFRGVDRPLILPADTFKATPSVGAGDLLFTWSARSLGSATAMPALTAADRIYIRDFGSDAGDAFDNYVNRADGHQVADVTAGASFRLNPNFTGLTLTPTAGSLVTVTVAKNRIRINLRVRSIVGRLTNYISP